MNVYLPTRKAKKVFNEYFYGKVMAKNSPEVAYRGAILMMLGTKEFSQPQAWAAFSLW
jgi:CHAT domain-containing protein